MSCKVASVLLSAIAAVLLCTLGLIEAVPAHAAAACDAAPKSTAPQGSHWYYRTNRASQRKCWYLAPEGQKTVSSPMVARTRIPPAPAATPSAETPAEQLTRPAGLRLTEPPAEQADAAVSRAATLTPGQPASVAEFRQEPASTPAAQERAKDETEVFHSLEERLAQLPASAAKVADVSAASPINTFQLILIALAAICLPASGAYYLAAVRRRATRIQIVDLGAKAPLRMGVTAGNAIAPRHSPADDDAKIDEGRLREFARTWKQQAAPRMSRRQPAPALIDDGHRFVDNDMRHARI